MVDKEIKKWIDGNLIAISNNLEELKELKITWQKIDEKNREWLDKNYISNEKIMEWLEKDYLTEFNDENNLFAIMFKKLFVRYNILNGHPIICIKLNESDILSKELYIDFISYTYKDYYYVTIKGGYTIDIQGIKFTNLKPQYNSELPSYDEVYMTFFYRDKNKVIGSLYTKEDLKKIGLIKE